MEAKTNNMSPIHTVTSFLIPQSLQEAVLLGFDVAAITVWSTIDTGVIHNVNFAFEFLIKGLTVVSLLLTVIYKRNKIKNGG